jgi:tryptophan halogenase
MAGQPCRVAVVGGGSAGWMAAAAFARFLGPGHAITLVESEAIGTVGVGEATIPQIRLFNAALGIAEADFLRETCGSVKLGIEFVDWSRPGSRYIHGFGPIGRDFGLVPFHHWWLRGTALGVASALGDYSPNIAAAVRNRFQPTEGAGALVHAYHFDAGLYAALLRRYAEARGIIRIEGRILAVEAEGDEVRRLRLEDGRTLESDLFIDATGFRSLLLGEALGVPYVDWSHWLPCDRALAVPSARVEPLTPYTRATARAMGWQWRIPLTHRTGNGLVYASRFCSDDEAAATLFAGLDGPALGEPRPLRFTAGHRAAFWRGNVVAIGLASGFLEPLESTSIHLVQTAIERVLALWPGARPDPALAAEYNRQTVFEFERIRDFLILHYHATARDDAPLWRHVRSMPIPETLAAKIDLFSASGRIVREGNELFTETGWAQVLIGQEVAARAFHPLAAQLPQEDLAELLALQAAHVAHQAERLGDHGAWLATLSQHPRARDVA